MVVGKKLRCKLGKHDWEEGVSRQKVCKDCGKVSSPGERDLWDKVKLGLGLAAVLAALGGLFAYNVWAYTNCKFIGCPP